MLDGRQRNVDPKLLPQVARPHATGQHDLLCLQHVAGVEQHSRGSTVRNLEARHAHVFTDGGATHRRTLGERPGDACRLDLTVVGNM